MNENLSGVIIAVVGHSAYVDIDAVLKRLGYTKADWENTLVFQQHSMMTFWFNRTIFFFPRLGAVPVIAVSHLQETLKRCQQNPNLKLVVFEGRLASLPGIIDVAQKLCLQGIDVVLAAEPTSSFYQTAAHADYVLKARPSCTYMDGNQVCGRPSQGDVVFNPTGRIPILEFAEQFFQHALDPLLRRFGKVEWGGRIAFVLSRIDRHYPRVRVLTPESVIRFIIGEAIVEHRCRAHSQEGLGRADRGGRIIVHTGPVLSRKSLSLALKMDQVSKGKMDQSPEVVAFSSLPRGTRSPIVNYEPRFVRNVGEIQIPESVTDVFLDEVSLLQGDILGLILDLARRGIHVHLAFYNPRGDGLPFAITAALLALADEVYSHLGECAIENCGSLCGQTQVTRARQPLPAGEFMADRFPDGDAIGLSFSPVCRKHHRVPGQNPPSTVIQSKTWFGEQVAALRDPRRLNYFLGGGVFFLLLFPGYAWLLGWPLREIALPIILVVLGILLCTYWWWERKIAKEETPRARITLSLFLGMTTLLLVILMMKILQLIIELILY